MEEERKERKKQIFLLLGFILVWEFLGRPFFAHLCPGHEMPPSLIHQVLELLSTFAF